MYIVCIYSTGQRLYSRRCRHICVNVHDNPDQDLEWTLSANYIGLAVNIMNDRELTQQLYWDLWDFFSTKRLHFTRAGHATILSRHRDHVFRPQKVFFIAILLYLLSFQTPRSKYITNLFWSLRLYYDVAFFFVAKVKNCRVPSSAFYISLCQFKLSCPVSLLSISPMPIFPWQRIWD